MCKRILFFILLLILVKNTIAKKIEIMNLTFDVPENVTIMERKYVDYFIYSFVEDNEKIILNAYLGNFPHRNKDNKDKEIMNYAFKNYSDFSFPYGKCGERICTFFNKQFKDQKFPMYIEFAYENDTEDAKVANNIIASMEGPNLLPERKRKFITKRENINLFPCLNITLPDKTYIDQVDGIDENLLSTNTIYGNNPRLGENYKRKIGYLNINVLKKYDKSVVFNEIFKEEYLPLYLKFKKIYFRDIGDRKINFYFAVNYKEKNIYLDVLYESGLIKDDSEFYSIINSLNIDEKCKAID